MYRRKKKKKRTLEYWRLYGYFFSFACFLLLTFVSIGLLVRTTVMNSSFVLRIVTGSQYTGLMTEQIQSRMVEWGANSGVTDETIFMNIVTQERVYEDTLTYFQNALTGQKVLDTTDLEQSLYAAIDAYAQAGDISEVTEAELQENIRHLVELCVDGYSQRVAVGLMPELGQIISRASRAFDIALLISAALIVLLIILLARWAHSRRRTLRYLIYAMTAGLILWWGSLIWIYSSRMVSRVALTSRPLYTLATDFLNAMLSRGLLIAIISTLLLIGLIVGRLIISRPHAAN